MTLRIAFLDVGQGDTTVLYDSESGDAVVLDCLNPIATIGFFEASGLKRIRALILTHFHADHYLGAVSLLEGCERRGIPWDACICRWDKDFTKLPELLRDVDGHSDMVTDRKRNVSFYRELLRWARQPENKLRLLQPHQLSREPPVIGCLKFLHPEHGDIPELFETANLNNLSYVVRVDAGGGVLLPGDLEAAGWRFLRKNHSSILASAILKFPHHGGWRGVEIAEILDDVSPLFVIISVGTGNSYGHPSPELFLELRRRSTSRVLCTQATSKCYNHAPRSYVLQVMQEESSAWASMTSNSKSSCPCAGTIIIDLSEAPKVLQPSLAAHVEKIIRPYMASHQCSLPEG